MELLSKRWVKYGFELIVDSSYFNFPKNPHLTSFLFIKSFFSNFPHNVVPHSNKNSHINANQIREKNLLIERAFQSLR